MLLTDFGAMRGNTMGATHSPSGIWKMSSRERASRRRERLALVAILLVSAALNLYGLHQVGKNGFGNAYYAAATKAMLTSWHHFFYLAVDPAGFIALDKAPLAPWIQAISARIFGFHGLSLLLPQALAGIVSVLVLYHLVSRAYGGRAGLLAALALAVTPISVVTNRNNTSDSLLVLALLLAAWAVMLAVEKGSLPSLLTGAALVGVAFNIKMLQILLVVPALCVVYLTSPTWPWRKRLLFGSLALVVALAVAAPWVAAVDLTPPGERPFVGGSTNNSVIDLVFGYNGFRRLWGEDWEWYLGEPGPFRFFNQKLGGQASWLLPLAIAGAILAVWHTCQRRKPAPYLPRERHAAILWSTWLAVQFAYFSSTLFYHRYYLATMAPAIAACVGMGAVELWRAWRSSTWRGLLPAIALLVSAGVQAILLAPYPDWSRWLTPLSGSLCLAAAVVLVVAWRTRRPGVLRLSRGAFTTGMLALLVTPTVWAALPVATCTNETMPYAGPQTKECRSFETRPFLDRDLVEFLQSQRDGARFLAATYDMGIAMLGILETGEPFMALGGYRGSDNILTLDEFKERIRDGEVRFFLTLTQETETFPQQEPIKEWVRDHCPERSVAIEGVEVRGPCECE
jgi:4-amino-4-deoxy-L-arabinose transferase-like glycosyltransferase